MNRSSSVTHDGIMACGFLNSRSNEDSSLLPDSSAMKSSLWMLQSPSEEEQASLWSRSILSQRCAVKDIDVSICSAALGASYNQIVRDVELFGALRSCLNALDSEMLDMTVLSLYEVKNFGEVVSFIVHERSYVLKFLEQVLSKILQIFKVDRPSLSLFSDFESGMKFLCINVVREELSDEAFELYLDRQDAFFSEISQLKLYEKVSKSLIFTYRDYD